MCYKQKTVNSRTHKTRHCLLRFSSSISRTHQCIARQLSRHLRMDYLLPQSHLAELHAMKTSPTQFRHSHKSFTAFLAPQTGILKLPPPPSRIKRPPLARYIPILELHAKHSHLEPSHVRNLQLRSSQDTSQALNHQAPNPPTFQLQNNQTTIFAICQ